MRACCCPCLLHLLLMLELPQLLQLLLHLLLRLPMRLLLLLHLMLLHLLLC